VFHFDDRQMEMGGIIRAAEQKLAEAEKKK